MNKFTPGPWEVTDETCAHVIRGADAPCVSNGTTFRFRPFVASIWGGYHEADARLIAAAPELLEALELVMDRLVDKHETDEAAVMARAAIAKSFGEQQ
jgi:hypothetical protein